jgi:hypothetical protein
VQHLGDGLRVGDDPGHVGGGRERADLQPPVRVAAQLVLEVPEVDTPPRVLADRDHVGARLPPRELVGVVLVGADEDDRAVQVEDPHELVDRAGGAGAAEHDRIVGAAVDGAVDDPARVLAQLGRRAAGRRRLGVRVRVHRQHAVADQILDERQRTPGRGVVGVDHAARPERALEHGVVADHRIPDVPDQLLHGRGHGSSSLCLH